MKKIEVLTTVNGSHLQSQVSIVCAYGVKVHCAWQIDYKREKSNQMKYLMLSFKIKAFFSTELAWKQNNSQVAESNTRKPKHAS